MPIGPAGNVTGVQKTPMGMGGMGGLVQQPQPTPIDYMQQVLSRQRLGAPNLGPVAAARALVPQSIAMGPQGYGGGTSLGTTGDSGSEAVRNLLFNNPPIKITGGVQRAPGLPPPAIFPSQTAPVGPVVTPAAPPPSGRIAGWTNAGPTVVPPTAAPLPVGQTAGSAGGGGPSQAVSNALNIPVSYVPYAGASQTGPQPGTSPGPQNPQVGRDPNDPGITGGV